MKGKAEKPTKSKDDWATPWSFVEFVEKTFLRGQKFVVDVCANRLNSKAEAFIDEDEDALTRPWPDGPVWCNPPFSKKEQFIDKAISEARTNGIETFMLLPASTGAKWFHKVTKYAARIVFIVGRLQFVGAPASADFDCCLAVFSPEWSLGCSRANWLEVPKEYRK
jgi:phage N-6-adenine-methyltransferase